MQRTIVVVGGGIFGVTGALELAKRGWSVTLLDPSPLPAETASSTDVSKVVRSDYGSDAFYQRLAVAALEGWDRWNADWERPLYHEDGFLILSDGPMAPGGFEYESRRVLTEAGAPSLPLDAPAPAARLEHFHDSEHGYFNPRGGWAESGAVVEQVARLAEGVGVRFEQARVVGIESSGSRVSGVRDATGAVWPAGAVVLAAGAWTPELAPWLVRHLRPVAQPIVHLRVAEPSAFQAPRFAPWAWDISGTGWYGFPALADGRLKIGHHGPGSVLPPDERGTVGAGHHRKVRDFLARVLPSVQDAPIVYERVCMYCDSFDGDLLIGRDPAREGLVVASGGSGHGFKFAPCLGPLIADAVEGRPNAWSGRLGWRNALGSATEEARFIPRTENRREEDLDR